MVFGVISVFCLDTGVLAKLPPLIYFFDKSDDKVLALLLNISNAMLVFILFDISEFKDFITLSLANQSSLKE